ncbi:hypothetical protein LINPERHAP1_LOCUS16135 [Linum perenne]
MLVDVSKKLRLPRMLIGRRLFSRTAQFLMGVYIPAIVGTKRSLGVEKKLSF